jgi:hypothetical protein
MLKKLKTYDLIVENELKNGMIADILKADASFNRGLRNTIDVDVAFFCLVLVELEQLLHFVSPSISQQTDNWSGNEITKEGVEAEDRFRYLPLFSSVGLGDNSGVLNLKHTIVHLWAVEVLKKGFTSDLHYC